jgi:hypothetical protein
LYYERISAIGDTSYALEIHGFVFFKLKLWIFLLGRPFDGILNELQLDTSNYLVILLEFSKVLITMIKGKYIPGALMPRSRGGSSKVSIILDEAQQW